ncbi:MAG: hypothetical protein J5949_03150, partial [Oscillospiraceae bacterium]|nr:hypothetical protein [Oscillospiraceae bacterium]
LCAGIRGKGAQPAGEQKHKNKQACNGFFHVTVIPPFGHSIPKRKTDPFCFRAAQSAALFCTGVLYHSLWVFTTVSG